MNVTPYVTPACIITYVSKSEKRHGFVYFKHEEEARGPKFAKDFWPLVNSAE